MSFYEKTMTKEQLEGRILLKLEDMKRDEKQFDEFMDNIITNELRTVANEMARRLAHTSFETRFKAALDAKKAELDSYAERYLATYMRHMKSSLRESLATRVSKTFTAIHNKLAEYDNSFLYKMQESMAKNVASIDAEVIADVDATKKAEEVK